MGRCAALSLRIGGSPARWGCSLPTRLGLVRLLAVDEKQEMARLILAGTVLVRQDQHLNAAESACEVTITLAARSFPKPGGFGHHRGWGGHKDPPSSPRSIHRIASPPMPAPTAVDKALAVTHNTGKGTAVAVDAVFEKGRPVACGAAFFVPGQVAQSTAADVVRHLLIPSAADSPQ
jgi:hypothetical protein